MMLKMHTLSRQLPPGRLDVLQRLTPNAQITVDNETKQLIIVATQSDHQKLADALSQLVDAGDPAGEKKLVVYPVTPAQLKRFQTVWSDLQTELPGARIVTDAEPGQMSAWARPEQHDVIANMLEQLKHDVPEGERFQLIAYEIKAAEPSSALQVMQELFPNTRFSLESRTRRILAWTRPDEHETIRAALEQIDSGDPIEGTGILRVHSVATASPEIVTQVITQVIPGAEAHADNRAGTVIVRARENEHNIIEGLVEQIRKGVQGDSDHVLAAYPTGQARSRTAVAKCCDDWFHKPASTTSPAADEFSFGRRPPIRNSSDKHSTKPLAMPLPKRRLI